MAFYNLLENVLLIKLVIWVLKHTIPGAEVDSTEKLTLLSYITVLIFVVGLLRAPPSVNLVSRWKRDSWSRGKTKHANKKRIRWML